MQLEKLSKRRIPLVSALAAGGLMLAACGPNYSGDGNDFVVQGKVTDPGAHSLKARIFEVDDADGSADGWFHVGTVHQLHDNCNCHGWLSSNKRYGEVLNVHGDQISPTDVAVGACVIFTGKIRANQVGKNYKNRPVYETAQVEQCPPGA